MSSKLLGNDRNGESPLWKLLRLWPIVVGVGALIGSYYVMGDDIKDLRNAQVPQWTKINKNSDEISDLKASVKGIERDVSNIDRQLTEQRSDIKTILREVAK